jgi:Rrf2 family protein
MKFSSQEEYGLRCLLQIAQAPSANGLTIPEISRLEGLGETHVAKLTMILRKAGLLIATRGQTGGYRLAKDASQVQVSDVLEILGGKLYDSNFCGRHSGQLDVCTHQVDCGVRGLWDRIQRSVDLALDGLSLADMLEGKHEPVGNVTLYNTPKRAKK